MWADLSLVRDQFQVAVAPVEYVGGWALLATIGTAFVVLSSDVFAFRAHARGEALVPGAVLFVFVAALGADRHRVALTLALIGAGFLAAALLRMRFAQTPRTVLGRARSPLSITLPAAAAAGVVVVLGAWVIGPRLPGANAEALVDTHNDSGGVTEVISPLVDIRSRLVNRAATELFVVTADAPSYWRVSGLPEFDGRTWGLPDRDLEDVSGALSEAAPGSTQNAQEIVISALSGELVPSAAEPVAASGEGLRWAADTSTLVRIDRDFEEGDRFEVVSAMPKFTGEALRAATSANPPDPIYLALPDDFPSSVSETAATVTAGAPTTYDAMLLLQNWFQSQFEYSLDVPGGHGNDAIEAFLRQRVGYCEQFAGTFAAMARSIGVPARVAVGFTPGTEQTRWQPRRVRQERPRLAGGVVRRARVGPVRADAGSRRTRSARATPGCPPAQDDSIPQPGQGAGGEAPATEGTVPPVEPIPGPLRIPRPSPRPRPISAPSATHRFAGPGTRWDLVSLVLLVPAALLALPELVRRWRRRHPSADAARQVAVLWERALGAIQATGFRVDPTLTPHRAGPGGGPTTPGGGTALEIARRPGDRRNVRAAGRGRGAGPADDRWRARPPALVPSSGAGGRRLDDGRRPPPALLHRVVVRTVGCGVAERPRGQSAVSRCRAGHRPARR